MSIMGNVNFDDMAAASSAEQSFHLAPHPHRFGVGCRNVVPRHHAAARNATCNLYMVRKSYRQTAAGE